MLAGEVVKAPEIREAAKWPQNKRYGLMSKHQGDMGLGCKTQSLQWGKECAHKTPGEGLQGVYAGLGPRKEPQGDIDATLIFFCGWYNSNIWLTFNPSGNIQFLSCQLTKLLVKDLKVEHGTEFMIPVDCNKCSGFTSGIYKPPTVDSFMLNSFSLGEQCWSYSQTLRICTRADANRIDTHTDLHKDTLSWGLPWWQDALEEGNPPQYPCLKNPKDSGAWQAIAYRVTQSWTWLKQLSMHAPSHGICCDASGIHQISLKQHAALGPI